MALSTSSTWAVDNHLSLYLLSLRLLQYVCHHLVLCQPQAACQPPFPATFVPRSGIESGWDLLWNFLFWVRWFRCCLLVITWCFLCLFICLFVSMLVYFSLCLLLKYLFICVLCVNSFVRLFVYVLWIYVCLFIHSTFFYSFTYLCTYSFYVIRVLSL